MTPRTAAWIVLAGLAVIAGCQRGSNSAPAPAADAAATPASAPDPSTSTVYMCPMDKDIRAHAPGKCPRCGMTLVNSIPEPAEYHLDVTASPAPAAGAPVRLTFEVTDPWTGNPVTKYSVIHEKLFHAFLVSEDLDVFRHVHPEWREDVHAFTYDTTLPKSGMYRVLGDFYPEAATPQLLAQTLVVPGPSADIKDAVLARRMPPWGAVKGFGEFRNDRGLTQEQVELVSSWIETGARRGNNRRMLPDTPTKFEPPPGAPARRPARSLVVSRDLTLDRDVVLGGVLPDGVRRSASMKVTAVRPDGSVEPLVWLYEYDERFRHAFLFRKPVTLPRGTIIRGVRAPARLTLLPVEPGSGG